MTTVSEIINMMPERFDPSAAANVNVTIQFNLSGDGGGSWYADIADGKLSVAEGTAENPKATIGMDAADFVAMSTGELNAMSAFMSGKVKVEGDLGTVMQLQSILGM